jgi:hypothetical protein
VSQRGSRNSRGFFGPKSVEIAAAIQALYLLGAEVSDRVMDKMTIFAELIGLGHGASTRQKFIATCHFTPFLVFCQRVFLELCFLVGVELSMDPHAIRFVAAVTVITSLNLHQQVKVTPRCDVLHF